MTIRTRLGLLVSLLLMGSMGLLSYGIIYVRKSYLRDNVERSAKVIENSVRRVALDALLQKDDIQLLSYVNFLKAQYPSLTYAKIHWQAGERVRSINLGQAPPEESRIEERLIEAADPADPARRVLIGLGIDRGILEESFREVEWGLQKTVLIGWILATILGLLASFWLARSLTGPIDSLGRLAGEIGSGHLGRRLEWKSDDEIGGLVRAFNKMSERLEDLDEAKKTFVSSVTHELRSPLGAIEGFLSLIGGKLGEWPGPRSVECREYLGRIELNVRRLNNFISSLLDIAKIEKGKLECVLKPMDLHETISDVCQFFGAKASQQGVEIQQQAPADLPAVLADADRVRQVLTNLIANSLKFTPQGGRIRVTAEQYREGEERFVEINVADTGPGLTAADRERLFKPFSQGENLNARVAGTSRGTGLGLYIVKSIIDQHGGKINVKSAPGRGTQIGFALKVVSPAAPQEAYDRKSARG